MKLIRPKYILSAVVLLMAVHLVFGFAPKKGHLIYEAVANAAQDSISKVEPTEKKDTAIEKKPRKRKRLTSTSARKSNRVKKVSANDSLKNGVTTPSSLDSLAIQDTIQKVDSIQRDSIKPKRKSKDSSLDEIIEGKNKDSLYYDVLNKQVFIYNQADVTYTDKNLTADFMRIDMNKKEIYAYGMPDTVGGKQEVTHPVFKDNGQEYKMDTITYNINSKKALISGVASQQGDGWLVGGRIKKQQDDIIHIQNGKYTTCDQTDHPHFYLAMTKAKVIPGKKVITGPAYLVMEDVPFYFLGLPEGFFPISSGPKNGILMPTYGEDGTRGFFIRGLGYYFIFGKHMDLALTGGIYTLGSWEVSASSRYMKRYKFSGNFTFDFSSLKTGDKGEPDYLKQNNFKFAWTHSQDPKANPGSTFSASVNVTSSGYSRYSATSLNDMLATQTNSSIAYSKSWAGTPFSLSMNMSISQNSQTKSMAVTLPSIVFNVARVYPFRRKEAVGKKKWYEQISFTYTGKMTNSVNAADSTLFTKQTLKDMKNGIQHDIPVSSQFTILKYINFTPQFNYSERWYFKRQFQRWNPEACRVEKLEPEYGFYRIYNYSASGTLNTTIYGMWEMKRKTAKVQAVRHTITPSIGFSYSPDFSKQKYGFYQTVQSDSLGGYTVYSPYSDNPYGVPGSGRSASLTFSLRQTLEMKVLSKRDTTGIKKIKLIDELGISGSYNFAADSMGLSNISLSFRTTIKGNFGINLSATLDPYEVSPQGVRYNKLMIRRGLPGRITSTGWSFGYTFKSRSDKSTAVSNDINSIPPEYFNPFSDPYGTLDPVLRRRYMAMSYYDFSIPWNLGFNYVISYGISYVNNGTTGYKSNVTQTIGFNGSINLTPKTGISFTSGFDIQAAKLTTTSVTITRDLHCWQMSFVWIPFGAHKSWSFNIGVKAASLKDLKYDKSQSMYDNMF
ncbi:MAG: LPS-assembly protein LptD [Alistipes sp.]|nr:LPS-assembly protein LptD [Candidatus Alistipes equi]